MESFLICTNPKCRYLINLRDGAQVLERSKLILDECPECGYQWSSHCPFCERPLRVIWRNKVPCCSDCGRTLKAEPVRG
jgi:hypothetical protein